MTSLTVGLMRPALVARQRAPPSVVLKTSKPAAAYIVVGVDGSTASAMTGPPSGPVVDQVSSAARAGTASATSRVAAARRAGARRATQ
jgi:hypothetical protein